MYFLKKLFSGILGFILCNIIIGMSLVFCLKFMLQGNLLRETFKQVIIQENKIAENSPEAEKIKSILNDDQANEIVNQVFDDYIAYLNGDQKELSEGTINSIIDYVKAHKNELESVTGESIDVDELSTEAKKNELFSFEKIYGEKNVQEKTTDMKALNLYKELTTKKTLYICIAIIIVILTIYSLINRSYFIWLKPLGSSLISAGALVCIAKILIYNLLINYMNVNLDYLLYIGITEIVLGILSIILYKVIKKKLREIDNNNINDISYFNNINTN